MLKFGPQHAAQKNNRKIAFASPNGRGTNLQKNDVKLTEIDKKLTLHQRKIDTEKLTLNLGNYDCRVLRDVGHGSRSLRLVSDSDRTRSYQIRTVRDRIVPYQIRTVRDCIVPYRTRFGPYKIISYPIRFGSYSACFRMIFAF